ncbi:NLP/P60 protein [Segniliparus rotundus DSM 44985]|uniref:NLP/P60 protein n=1 Tax=Segniliparus rotundus (strain ATCC BAA-972 / CDC 1076 / CIP 108378 / DSM 44985 / JCM 13578) TaxID=640132 RepID=D6ZF13_SEGRD|nr:NLP/P60 protein [Segniliparus rotundus DSM 44985]
MLDSASGALPRRAALSRALISQRLARRLPSALLGAVVAIALSMANAWSDPNDPVAQLRALARQSEQTEEAQYQAMTDLNAAHAARAQAQTRLAEDQAKQEQTKAVVEQYQGVVDMFVETAYNGVRLNEVYALLVSKSPGQLLDQMSDIKVIAADVQDKVTCYKAAHVKAQQAAADTAQALDAAKAAEQRALAKRAELQAKEAQLQQQIAAIKDQYTKLTPQQLHDFSVNPMEGAAPQPESAAPPAQVLPPEAEDAVPPDAQKKQEAAPRPPESSDAPEEQAAESSKGRAVQAALSRVGRPYVWGGSGPGVFDCSGLVMWSYQQVGRSMPHSSQAQDGLGRHIGRGDLQPGDLVTYYSGVSHVALYIGNGMVVHAPTYGQPVTVAPIDAAGPVHAFVRIG